MFETGLLQHPFRSLCQLLHKRRDNRKNSVSGKFLRFYHKNRLTEMVAIHD